MSEKAPREFEPVEDIAEALKLVREGAKTLSSAMIWTKDQAQVINSHISVYSDAGHCFYCWTPKDFDPHQFMDEMAKSGESECYFSISLLRANIFFKTRFVGFDSAGLQFKLPTKVFNVQRRKNLRFPIPDGYTIKADYADPLSPETVLTKKILDMSAGGISFLIQENEVPIYPAELILKDLSFTVRGKKITVSAEVRHAKKLPEGSRFQGFAVGVMFKEIRAADSQHIAGFVFEESRKYFSRFI